MWESQRFEDNAFQNPTPPTNLYFKHIRARSSEKLRRVPACQRLLVCRSSLLLLLHAPGCDGAASLHFKVTHCRAAIQRKHVGGLNRVGLVVHKRLLDNWQSKETRVVSIQEKIVSHPYPYEPPGPASAPKHSFEAAAALISRLLAPDRAWRRARRAQQSRPAHSSQPKCRESATCRVMFFFCCAKFVGRVVRTARVARHLGPRFERHWR